MIDEIGEMIDRPFSDIFGLQFEFRQVARDSGLAPGPKFSRLRDIADRIFAEVERAAKWVDDPLGVAEIVSDFFTDSAMTPDFIRNRAPEGKVVSLHETTLLRHIDRNMEKLRRVYEL